MIVGAIFSILMWSKFLSSDQMLAGLLVVAVSINFGPNVATLTGAKFSKEVDWRPNNTVWFVMFHGTHCPACQQIYPEFIKAANEAAGMVKFGQVNVNDEYSLAGRFSVRQIPAFYLFYPGGQSQYQEYPQSRKMLNAACARIPRLAEAINETWLANSESKSAILFTDKPACPPIWAAISCEFINSTLRIGISNDKAMRSKFKVTSVPSILLIDGDQQMTYEGKMAFPDVLKGIKSYFSDTEPKPTPKIVIHKKSLSNVLVHKLVGLAEFNQECKGQGTFCVVEGAEKPSETYEKLAEKYRREKTQFYFCGQDCPLDYARSGVWILHHKREAGIRLESLDAFESTLERVLDGRGEFKPMSTFLGKDL
jgi:thiol-disulfide isomerase/thioredoxin